MTLIKRNIHGSPWFNAFFDDELSRSFITSGMFTKGTTPAVNISETNTEFKIYLAVPGMKKENFKIDLSGTKLTISSQVEPQEESSDVNYRQREFFYSSFSRSFELPEKKVDFEKINASYTDGILEVTIPKIEIPVFDKNKTIEIK